MCTGGGCQGGTCGKVGQRSCGGGVGCTAPYSDSDNGACRACGGSGQRCWNGAEGNFCAAPFTCGQNDTCTTCGGAGQACCPGNTCSGGRTCTQNRCN